MTETEESVPVRAARYLAQTVQKTFPRQRVPSVGTLQEQRWAEELERLQRLDGFSWREIRAMMDFLPEHERGGFRWGEVVLSPQKLRRHAARIWGEMQKKPKAPENPQDRFYRETPDTRAPMSAEEAEAVARRQEGR